MGSGYWHRDVYTLKGGGGGGGGGGGTFFDNASVAAAEFKTGMKGEGFGGGVGWKKEIRFHDGWCENPGC